MAAEVLCCGFCPFKSVVKREIFKHLKECHAQDPGFHVRCLLCWRTFKVVSSFSSHVSRLHPGIPAKSAYDNEITSTEIEQSSPVNNENLPLDNIDNSSTLTFDHDIPDISWQIYSWIEGKAFRE